MKNKVILKLLSLLPHFIFKRLVYPSKKNLNNVNLDNSSKNYTTSNFYGQFLPPLDKVIYERYFKNKIPSVGVAVECGAFDGISESTCLFFEESLGWNVFNIEASPNIFKNLIKNRPYSYNYQFGLSNEIEVKTFKHVIHPTFGQNFGNGSFKHKELHKEILLKEDCTFEEYKVETLTLDRFFEMTQINQIDLFVLDVEGYELNVLKRLQSSKVRPVVFCVEKQLDHDWDEILKILINSGYKYIEDIHNNSIFVLSDYYKSYLSDSNIHDSQSYNSFTKPRVNILSNLYQESEYIESFFDQIKNLHQKNFELGTVFISTNGPKLINKTFKQHIKNMPFKIELKFDPELKIDEFSMNERSRKWSLTTNLNIKKSLETPSEFTVILEADLTYPPDTVDYLVEANVDVVAPVTILANQFYDSWGYRDLNGKKIYDLKAFNKPISESTNNNNYLLELNSVGSFVCIKTNYLKEGIRLPAHYEDGLLVGLCNCIRRMGGKVYCHTGVSLIHPTLYWKNQLWNTNIEIIEFNGEHFSTKKSYTFRLHGFEDIHVEKIIKEQLNLNVCFYFTIINKTMRSSNIYIFETEKVALKFLENMKTDDNCKISRITSI